MKKNNQIKHHPWTNALCAWRQMREMKKRTLTQYLYINKHRIMKLMPPNAFLLGFCSKKCLTAHKIHLTNIDFAMCVCFFFSFSFCFFTANETFIEPDGHFWICLRFSLCARAHTPISSLSLCSEHGKQRNWKMLGIAPITSSSTFFQRCMRCSIYFQLLAV